MSDNFLLTSTGFMNILEDLHHIDNHDEETCKRINNIVCTRTSMQVEHSHDAVRIRAKNDGFLHEQLENQNCLGKFC